MPSSHICTRVSAAFIIDSLPFYFFILYIFGSARTCGLLRAVVYHTNLQLVTLEQFGVPGPQPELVSTDV